MNNIKNLYHIIVNELKLNNFSIDERFNDVLCSDPDLECIMIYINTPFGSIGINIDENNNYIEVDGNAGYADYNKGLRHIDYANPKFFEELINSIKESIDHCYRQEFLQNEPFLEIAGIV